MNAGFKSLLTSMLCLCLAGGLLCGCTMKKNEQPTAETYLSEQTQTESFPVRLETAEESHIIQSKPRKLAVLSADLLQALEDIGAASLVCAVSNDAPTNISVSGAKVCGSVLDPEMSDLIAARPDWVLVSSDMRESQKEELSEQGIGVITFSHPESFESIKERYRQLFTLCYGLDGTARAEQFLADYDKKLNDAIGPASEYSRISGQKQAVYLAQLDYTMATGETFEGEILDTLGMYNLGELGSRWHFPEVEKEELKPDILFYDSTIDPEKIRESEVYKDSPAVQSEQMFAIDFAAMRLRGLPMIDELAKIARAAYPQAYGTALGN